MTSEENVPLGDRVSKNAPTRDARHENKVPASDQESLPRLMRPLAIRSNIPCPPPVEDRHSAEVAKGSPCEAPSGPEGSKLDRDNVEQQIQLGQSSHERSNFGSPDENINDQQNNEDEYDFDSDDDDDISIDDDPFFGDAGSEAVPCRPTEEQMDAIQKTMEEDEKAAKRAYEEKLSQEAIRKVLTEDVEPPALISNDDNDVPDPIVPPHPLLTDQNYNATDMLISIRSSFAGDVFHIVGVTEPLLEMKRKFVQAVNLSPSELGTLEFLCGYHVIQDDDTVEKVCCSPHHCFAQVANADVAHDRTRIDHLLPEDWRHAL